MAQIIGAIQRNRLIGNPPSVEKGPRPLRFGILGASNFAPTGLLTPAKTHADVVIHAVAARNTSKAENYAKQHSIPVVKSSYQDLINDPEIDCVYIPLPSRHHFEWALKALKAGKHVYLEKPSVATHEEANELFRHPVLTKSPAAPVLLESSHFHFHPAWAHFMSFIKPEDVTNVSTTIWCPYWNFGLDDIRFDYELGGGAMIDLGPYAMGSMRLVFGDEPIQCEECIVGCPPGNPKVDKTFTAKYRFPNGAVGEARGDLKAPLTQMALWPTVTVWHKPVVVDKKGHIEPLNEDEELVMTKEVHFENYVQPAIYHWIRVNQKFEVRQKVASEDIKKDKEGNKVNSPTVKRTWSTSTTTKAYTFGEFGADGPGEPYWTSWRHCLGQFVTKVRGQEPHHWWTADDSINTTRMIDMAYEASGIGLRPRSEYIE